MTMTNTEILKDWIKGRNEDFIHVRKEGRDCWEDSLEGGSLSAAFAARSFDSEEELMTKAYSIAMDTVKSMNTGYDVKIYLGGKDSGTNFKKLNVATNYFNDESLSTTDKADIFIGLTIHEACHLLYTKNGLLGEDQFVNCMTNIIEDERIERKLGDEKPGVANFLGPTKRHYFGRKVEDAAKEMDGDDPVQEFTNLLLRIIRYPRDIDESLVEKYKDYLVKCKNVLEPFPDSTEECVEAAKKIKEIIKKLFKDEKKRKDDRETSSNDDVESGKCEYGKKEKGNGGKGDSSSDSDGVSSPSDDGAEVKGDGGGDPSEGKEKSIGQVMKGLCDVLSKLSSGELKSKDVADGIKSREINTDVVDGTISRGEDKNTFFIDKIKPNKQAYEAAYNDVKKYVPAMSRAIRGFSEERSMLFSGLKEGKLDTHKLSQAIQGDQNIYSKMFTQKVNRMNVCLLVDESGSMIREGRMTAARKTAILINEAIGKQNNINLMIYGHSADENTMGETLIRAYRENGKFDKYVLGDLAARDNNRDGIAILETAKRIRKFTSEETLMFVISDGSPAAQGYIGREAIAHTKSCVEQAEKMGFKVIQICINASYDPALMFKRYLKLEDMSTLAKDLGKVITKALTEKKRIRTSL